MKTWEELVYEAKRLAAAAGRKVTDAADLAKMKYKITENDKAIEATMEALGRLLYDSRKSETALNEETVTELMTQVDELNADNARLQAEIDNSRGKRTCAACGAVNEESAVYCNKCGHQL